MPVYQLLHAFTTGAATFGLNPSLPNVLEDVASLRKTPSEAFRQDAIKLQGDYQRALVEVAKLSEQSGHSIAIKA